MKCVRVESSWCSSREEVAFAVNRSPKQNALVFWTNAKVRKRCRKAVGETIAECTQKRLATGVWNCNCAWVLDVGLGLERWRKIQVGTAQDTR